MGRCNSDVEKHVQSPVQPLALQKGRREEGWKGQMEEKYTEVFMGVLKIKL